MKKFILILIFIFLLIYLLLSKNTTIIDKYKLIKIMKLQNQERFRIGTVDYFLNDEDKNRFDKININKNGDVEYKGKVLYTEDGKPLNKATASTTLELKILFAAMKVQQREGCDPGDMKQNGSLGCYIDIPDDN